MKKNQKKALIVASVASMISQFNIENIKILKKLGYKVEVAANFKFGNTCNNKEINKLKLTLERLDVKYYQVDFYRNAIKIFKNISAYKQIKNIADSNFYHMVHCHSPIGGVITRLIFNKYRCKGTKVIYTAHGFHFYKGAPLINWLTYFPIEKYLSKFTDVLITITKDDYKLAKSKFFTKKIVYVPGVGIDTKKFARQKNFLKIRNKIRKILGLNDSDKLILSVGELNKNKNHQIVIKSLSMLSDKNIHYAIAGEGQLKKYLQRLAHNMKVNLHLLGYRNDIRDLYFAADIYCLPSIREGLNVSLMEAASSGLLCVASDIRGNSDIIKNCHNGYLYKCTSITELYNLLYNFMYKKIHKKHRTEYIIKQMKIYDKSYVKDIYQKIYKW